jgi:succinate dehydrogenase / fumarate reductase, cytochrome b subunit
MSRSPRPLSPHLQVYRWELTMVLSILHRMTGAALSVGSVLLVWWLVAAAAGAEHFTTVQTFVTHPLGQLILVGFTFSLFLHLANGVRHLAWDVGWGFEIPQAFATGWAVVVFASVATVLVWVLALGFAGGGG